MFKIEVKGLKELQAQLKDLGEHRMNKTTAIALTETARTLRDHLQKDIKNCFDRPTRWTTNSLFFKSASATDFKALVWFKDPERLSQRESYLLAQVQGGARELKPYEQALQRFGVLPGGYYTVPGAGIKLDRHGNIPTGTITEILTGVRALQGMSDTRFSGVMGGYKLRKKTTANFFVVKVKHGGLEPGIWQRVPKGTGVYQGSIAMEKGKTKGEHYYKGVGRRTSSLILARGVRPILLFVKAPRYAVRLPFYDIAQKFVDIEFPKIFNRLADETLAYWKGKGKR